MWLAPQISDFFGSLLLYTNPIRLILNSLGVKKDKNSEGFTRITAIKDDSDLPLMDVDGVIEILKQRKIFGARFIVPCPKDFFALRLKPDAHAPYVSRYQVDYNIKMDFPQIVSPYILKTDRTDEHDTYVKVVNDNLYNWVYSNRYSINTTREEIVEAYNRFCSVVDLDIINNKTA